MKIKKELQSLLKWVEKNGDQGSLCWARHFQIHGIHSKINLDHKDPVIRYFKEMRPRRGKFYCKEYKSIAWFWPTGNQNIRIKWLKSLIKRTPASLEI